MDMTIAEFRADLAEALNRVAYSGEQIVLRRHGKALAALVPVEALRLLEQVIAEREDALDAAAIKKGRRSRAKSVSLDQVKRELGLPIRAATPARRSA